MNAAILPVNRLVRLTEFSRVNFRGFYITDNFCISNPLRVLLVKQQILRTGIGTDHALPLSITSSPSLITFKRKLLDFLS